VNRKQILEVATKCVCGERQDQYGSPKDNFDVIAKLWTDYIGATITATDVAMMLCLLKIARIKTGSATEDSFVDLAGYVALGAEVEECSKAAAPCGAPLFQEHIQNRFTKIN